MVRSLGFTQRPSHAEAGAIPEAHRFEIIRRLGLTRRPENLETGRSQRLATQKSRRLGDTQGPGQQETGLAQGPSEIQEAGLHPEARSAGGWACPEAPRNEQPLCKTLGSPRGFTGDNRVNVFDGQKHKCQARS